MKRTLYLLGTTLFALGLISNSACSGGKACTLIGCGPALRLDFSQPILPGTYTVDITTDGKTSRCDFVLSKGTNSSCGEVSAGLTSDELSIYPALSQLDVELKDADGHVLAAQSYVPDYAESYPNGEGCGRCLSASDELAVSQ